MKNSQNRPRKAIKKAIRLILMMLLILLLVPILVGGLLLIPSVQNATAHWAASYLSEMLGSEVVVSGLRFKPFTDLSLDGVLIRDHHADTLIYAESLDVGLIGFDRHTAAIGLGEVTVINGYFNMKKYESDTTNNLMYFINAFPSSDDTTTSNTVVTIAASHVNLINLRYNYHNMHVPDTSVRKIDFEHIEVKGMHGRFNGVMVVNDSISAHIERMTLHEKSGFILNEFEGDALVTANRIRCQNMHLKTNNARVQGNYEMISNGWDNYGDFIEKVRLEADLEESDVRFDDIAYFTPQLYGLLTHMVFTGQVSGTISNLKANVQDLRFEQSGQLAGKIKVKGLPDINNTFVDADLRRFHSTFEDAQKVNIPVGDGYIKLEFPEQINALGYVDFQGKFIGFVNDFVTYGNIKTKLGVVDADVNMKTRDGFEYSGHVFTSGFQLGTLLGIPSTVQRVSLDLDINGSGVELNTLEVEAVGSLREFGILNYNYRNLAVDGSFKRKVFTGNVVANDTNIQLGFAGLVDLNGNIPKISAKVDVDRLQLANLNLVPKDTHGVFSGDLVIEMRGTSTSDLNGTMKLFNPRYENERGVVALDSVILVDELIQDGHEIRLTSDIASLHVMGRTSLIDMPFAFLKVSHEYAPGLTPEIDVTGRDTLQHFDFHLKVDNNNDWFKFLAGDIRLGQPLFIEGNLEMATNNFELRTDSVDLSIKGIKFYGTTLTVKPDGHNMVFVSDVRELHVSDGFFLQNFHAVNQLRRDSLLTSIKWQNESEQADSGGLDLIVYRGKYYPLNAVLNSLNVRIAGVEWKSAKVAQLQADTNRLIIDDLDLRSAEGYINSEGVLDPNTADHLKFDIKDFNLHYLSNFKVMEQDIEGMLNGNVDLSWKGESLVADADIELDSLSFDGFLIGNISGTSEYDDQRKQLSLNIDLEYQGMESMKAAGVYYPYRNQEQLDVEVAFTEFHLQNLQPFLTGVISNINGNIDGSVSVTGNLDRPLLNGGLKLTDGAALVDYLNVEYSFPIAEVSIDPTSFSMSNTSVYDVRKQSAIAELVVSHQNFKDLRYEISVDAHDFQCLNTSLIDNPDYYGEAYVTGIVKIVGSSGETKIAVDAETDDGTKLFIPLSGSGDVSEFEYIRFVEPKSFAKVYKTKALEDDVNTLELDFRLSVSDNSEIQIIFDEKVGDIIKVKGEGDMLMQIDNKGTFNMFGEYVITEGDYLFTLQNIVNKKFTVNPGSKLTWNGDPDKAHVDIVANYKLRASPLVMVESMTGPQQPGNIYEQRLPVNVGLYMDGLMTSPDISFGVNMPSLSETDVANQLLDPSIASQEQITSQAFSLLLANNFSPGTGNVSLGGTGQNTGYEMLSNQLSNWLSQYSDKFDLGVRYSEGDIDQNTASQTELSFSTDFFNNRVSVEVNGTVQGNTETDDTQESNSNVAGEFNVEYKINKDGSLKARVFNEANNYSAANLNQSPYTQGVGLFYRNEFDTFGEFVRNIFRKKHRKKDSDDEDTE